MWLKEILKKNFSEDKKISLERSKAAKFVFIISALVFFMTFYFVWANFYTEITSKILSISYIVLVISLVLFAYLFIRKSLSWKVPSVVFFLIFILLWAVLAFLLLPVIVDGWINSILWLLNFYY
jgi:predicted neutral ceramidase superfamily lipid hydrolase